MREPGQRRAQQAQQTPGTLSRQVQDIAREADRQTKVRESLAPSRTPRR